MFHNSEFTFDVDLSTLPCGLNGAVYFSAMSADGDMGVGNNNAGAKFGTGYRDSQCPKDIKFINGQVSILCHSVSGINSHFCLGQLGRLERHLRQLWPGFLRYLLL